MTNSNQNRAGPQNAYTHAAHAAHIGKCMSEKVSAVRALQVQKNGVTYCAQIVDAFSIPDGPDCWKVKAFLPEMAIFSVPVSKARVCGHGCTCVAEQQGRGPACGGGGLDA
jgi:hypothetical protein